MKRQTTIKKQLENAGYVVIEREDTLVLAQELQLEKFDEELGFAVPPMIHPYDCDTLVNEAVTTITGEDWFWECEYPTTFKMYKA